MLGTPAADRILEGMRNGRAACALGEPAPPARCRDQVGSDRDAVSGASVERGEMRDAQVGQ